MNLVTGVNIDDYVRNYEKLLEIANAKLKQVVIDPSGNLVKNKEKAPQKITGVALQVLRDLAMSVVQSSLQFRYKQRVIPKLDANLLSYSHKYFGGVDEIPEFLSDLYIDWSKQDDTPAQVKDACIKRALVLTPTLGIEGLRLTPLFSDYNRLCNILSDSLEAAGFGMNKLIVWSKFCLATEKIFFSLLDKEKDDCRKKLKSVKETFELAALDPKCPPLYLRTLASMLSQLMRHDESGIQIPTIKNLLNKVYALDPAMCTELDVIDQIVKNYRDQDTLMQRLYAKTTPHRWNEEEGAQFDKEVDRIRSKIKKNLESGNHEKAFRKISDPKIQKLFAACIKAKLTERGLTLSDVFSIACFVQKGFFIGDFKGHHYQEDGADELVYVEQGACTPLLINLTQKSFTVILGSPRIQSVCTEKIYDAVAFVPDADELVSFPSVSVVKRVGFHINQKTVTLLQKFQQIRGLGRCDSFMEYEEYGTLTQMFVQDRVRGNLLQFVEERVQDGISTPDWQLIYAILEDVAHGLTYLHTQGYVHWAVTAKHVQYVMSATKTYEHECMGMLSTFSKAFKVTSGEQPPQLFPLYGEPRVRAPEAYIQTTTLTPKAAMQRECFALGCMLYEILESIDPPKTPMHMRLQNKEVTEQNIDAFIQGLNTFSYLPSDKALRLMALHLVHPNLKKRWNINNFLEAIEKVRAEQFEASPRWNTSSPLYASRLPMGPRIEASEK